MFPRPPGWVASLSFHTMQRQVQCLVLLTLATLLLMGALVAYLGQASVDQP